MSTNYTVISSDTHCGGSHQEYREYLDPAFHDDFDAWRGEYKNPWKDLRDTDLRIRSWDDDRRDADQLSDGVVGEIAIAREAIEPGGQGTVQLRGSEWIAHNVGDRVIPEATRSRVESISGATVSVRAAD